MTGATKQWIGWVTFSLTLALLIRAATIHFTGHAPQRTLVTDVVQGIIAGAVLAYFTANLIIAARVRSIQTTVNGWSTTLRGGAARKDMGILLRAACAKDVSALSVPEEEVYWQAFVDGAGRKLNGKHAYRLHFPPGGLPPNEASWSLTVGDSGRRMVENPIHRYSVGGRSGLVPNADGSIDVYIQHTDPAVHEPNWLPAPGGDFMLWVRVYHPGAAILTGAYRLPPVVAAT
ncbi:MAG: DUF1214 domain-containing protein [Isosphaeraceae bacterium]